MTEPLWLRQRRSACALSADHGLGALKYLLDPLKVDIIRHRYVGVNYVTLRRGHRKSKEFKLYTAGRMNRRRATYLPCNFTREDAPEAYLFLTFDPEPLLWTATCEELCAHYSHLYTEKNWVLPPGEGGVSLSWRYGEVQENTLLLRLGPEHPMRVTSHKDLGL